MSYAFVNWMEGSKKASVFVNFSSIDPEISLRRTKRYTRRQKYSLFISIWTFLLGVFYLVDINVDWMPIRSQQGKFLGVAHFLILLFTTTSCAGSNLLWCWGRSENTCVLCFIISFFHAQKRLVRTLFYNVKISWSTYIFGYWNMVKRAANGSIFIDI